MENFRIGDRIKVIYSSWDYPNKVSLKDKLGTVKAVGVMCLVVEFDISFPEGHDGSFFAIKEERKILGKNHHCWGLLFDRDEIKKIGSIIQPEFDF